MKKEREKRLGILNKGKVKQENKNKTKNQDLILPELENKKKLLAAKRDLQFNQKD